MTAAQMSSLKHRPRVFILLRLRPQIANGDYELLMSRSRRLRSVSQRLCPKSGERLEKVVADLFFVSLVPAARPM
ncbi:hypothetical protein EV356DRAFT_504069 [Viridothelium virens]|uniref:Uncharacterized protein n=1 Tax=Viridothelium virens TaxID=1048519 RepID=A0A6A6HMK8_VIRVR|nr:hypothetical protein EV356DRAFT_504069 [Viridothelium virens]